MVNSIYLTDGWGKEIRVTTVVSAPSQRMASLSQLAEKLLGGFTTRLRPDSWYVQTSPKSAVSSVEVCVFEVSNGDLDIALFVSSNFDSGNDWTYLQKQCNIYKQCAWQQVHSSISLKEQC
ncbi:MAG: hypothetical protein S4CHLAM81_08980 [Chlamydiales bacterium]|nr:hypothetical protein [Chlamydiales bacterium]MCH9635678.1 hypothetical protein [Chlamydiales bacterium]